MKQRPQLLSLVRWNYTLNKKEQKRMLKKEFKPSSSTIAFLITGLNLPGKE
jgi:hypothetical protein